MATDTSQFDLGAIVSSSLKSSGDATGGTSVSARGSSAPDIDALTKILQTATGVVAAEGAKQKLITETEGQLSQLRANVLQAGAANLTAAGEAESRLAEAKAQNEIQAAKDAAAVAGAAGLSLDSVLGKSIATINASYDRANANLAEAEKRQGVSLADVLAGDMSFGSMWEARVTHPAKEFEDKAKNDLAIAQNEAQRIAQLQNIVTGQDGVNNATRTALYEGAAADAARVAAAKTVREATSLQEQALAVGANYAQNVMTQSRHAQATAHTMGTLAIGVENAKRQWAAFDAKDTDPQVLAGYVRVAMKTLGRPDADLYTAQYVEEFKKMNPKNGAMIASLANTGMILAGHQAVTPNEPLPAALGAPSEVYSMLRATGGKLPTGSEQFQSKLMSMASVVEADETLKPAERAIKLDNSSVKWIDEVVTNVDNSEYGRPVLPALISMASMNSPEVAPFTERVLKPLATAGNVVDADTLLAAVKAADLPQATKIAGLQAYANSASAHVDATRRPQLLGFPTAASLPYTASVHSGSLFGTKTLVNLKDEKSIRDYLFKSEMYSKHKVALAVTPSPLRTALTTPASGD